MARLISPPLQPSAGFGSHEMSCCGLNGCGLVPLFFEYALSTVSTTLNALEQHSYVCVHIVCYMPTGWLTSMTHTVKHTKNKQTVLTKLFCEFNLFLIAYGCYNVLLSPGNMEDVLMNDRDKI